MHLVSSCSKLVQKQYKRRHDDVARIVNWELCKKHGLECSDRWYEHTPADVVENDEVEFGNNQLDQDGQTYKEFVDESVDVRYEITEEQNQNEEQVDQEEKYQN